MCHEFFFFLFLNLNFRASIQKIYQIFTRKLFIDINSTMTPAPLMYERKDVLSIAPLFFKTAITGIIMINIFRKALILRPFFSF